MRRLIPLLLIAMAALCAPRPVAAAAVCVPFTSFPLVLNFGTGVNTGTGEDLNCATKKFQASINALANLRGAPSGIATLGIDGLLTPSQAPAALGTLASQVGALATTVGTNTANISANTAAIGTLNGKLGAANGIATLGSDGKVLPGQLPSAAASSLSRYNPRDYGATCNNSGTGDDAGMASAISALQNAGGGALVIPGKCVITTGKIVSGVPVAVIGDGYGTSQIVGASNWGGSNAFLLRLDISAGSNLTAYVQGLGFRTRQAEVASALQIEANFSGLEERAIISDVEVRGDNPGTQGFSYGIRFTNVGGPRITRTTVTGRQSGNGSAGLTNMNVCYDIVTTGGGPGGAAITNYNFSDTRCNASKIGWNAVGYIEGVLCTRCYAIAVNTGWYMRPGQIVPLLSIAQSHADFFSAGVDMQYFSQSYFTANIFYHRSDATSTGTCYYFKYGKTNNVQGGGCFESGTSSSTVGVVNDASNNNVVSDVSLDGLIIGVNNVNGATGNVYRRGQFINMPSGGGEHGNGGSATNVCIGYNAAC